MLKLFLLLVVVSCYVWASAPAAPPRKKVVAIYVGYYYFPYWSPATYMTSGLGGSETAAMQLAKGLVKWGYEVYVGGGVETGDWDGVHYRTYDAFTAFVENNVLDVMIISRYLHSYLEHRIHAKHIVMWAHDNTFVSYWSMEPMNEGGQALVGWHMAR
jgi:hypothetical protein